MKNSEFSEFIITIRGGNYPSFFVEEVTSNGDLLGRDTELYESGFASYEEAKKRCDKLTSDIEEEMYG
jgi:hypothetical protein